ncbi:Zinc finger, ZZ-type [Plasmopara halstedii]|uniref:Zinc finger, ZZ-type n=1 Tax=Plasmopara halstedii TaxID=4781 RepID=A0A0P1AHD9_PLAHL|nr:Zinc finger, ZZ-type [Plasmopara halstedii]CEG40630.1 Zinc finger, ZZ-type [Plasmopara halstedii]|eukprot:XP_024576999.1 Zinc finger, ZZ-type [Plasmopara halstedii]
MVTTVTLQHNLAALQTQVEALQVTNSALTRDLCLKENYIQLKDQQFRVMQRRLEELEGSVAQWKDRWLQIVNAQPQMIPHTRKLENDEMMDVGTVNRAEDVKWTPWKCKVGMSNRTKAVGTALAKLEKFSQLDKKNLQPLLKAIEEQKIPAMSDLIFSDVSEELSRILLLYLLPALHDTMDGHLECFSRTYYKQTMDFRITTLQNTETTCDERSTSFNSSDKSPSTSLSIRRTTSFPESSEETLVLTPQGVHEMEDTETPHLFDCIELDRRGLARPSIPHGPRELHATKAMFTSQPLSGVAATRAVVPLQDKTVDKSLDKSSRRYTLTPKRSGPTFAVETRRTYTMTMGALPSPGQSPSSMNMLPIGSDGEVIPMPPREKDGKIKKIVGSVFDRLSRHKSQQTLATTASFQASPIPASGSTGNITDGSQDEDESICDGCGRKPLVNIKWICRSCRLLNGQQYELCEKCYGQGIHGKEQEDALFVRVEAIVVRKCPRLGNETELLHLLRMGVCKANVKKFSFCLTWIADLLQCHRTTDLRARALEIAHIPSTVRSEFTRLLRDLLMRYRPDIELKSEWEPAASAQFKSLGPGTTGMRGDEVPEEFDTLRIRVKDAPVATTEPRIVDHI